MSFAFGQKNDLTIGRDASNESKRILEKEAGKKVQFIAYPYGDYDDRVAEAAGKAGYTAALTCDFGRVKKGSDPLRMKRFVIDDKMDFADFRKYLGATPMQVAEVTPKPGVVEASVTTVSAKINAMGALGRSRSSGRLAPLPGRFDTFDQQFGRRRIPVFLNRAA